METKPRDPIPTAVTAVAPRVETKDALSFVISEPISAAISAISNVVIEIVRAQTQGREKMSQANIDRYDAAMVGSLERANDLQQRIYDLIFPKAAP